VIREKRHTLRHDTRVADDSRVPQAVRRYEEAAGPGAGDRLSIRHRDDVIGVVMDHEEWRRPPPRQRHDIEVRPREPDAPLAGGAESVDHVGTEAELPRPKQRVADGIRRRRDEHGAAHYEPPFHRQRGHRRAKRVRHDSMHRTIRFDDGTQRPSHLRHRAHAPTGVAVREGIERDDPEAGIDERLDIGREPAAARPPTMHQVDCRSFTPRPPRDPLSFHFNLERLSAIQDCAHPRCQVRAVWSEEEPLGEPSGGVGRNYL